MHDGAHGVSAAGASTHYADRPYIAESALVRYVSRGNLYPSIRRSELAKIQDRSISSDPRTEYFVYEFLVNKKVFYVGHTYGVERHSNRWNHFKPIVKSQDEGRISESELKKLRPLCAQVIAWLIRNGGPELVVTRGPSVLGKEGGARQEKLTIDKRIREGCILSNEKLVPRPLPSRDQVLKYLGVM